jgi:hypothetical protein
MALQPTGQPLRTADPMHSMQVNLQQMHPQSTEQLPIHWAAYPSPTQPSQLNALLEQPWPRLLCRSTSHCNGTSLPPLSFATEPKKALENMSFLHTEGQGRLPKYVSGLPLQQLPCGCFSALDLTWHHITERSASSLVAAIPKARLDDFVAGEEERGNSTVNMWVMRQKSGGVLMNKRAECFYAAPKHASQKDRKLQLPSDKPLPTVPGKEARRGSLQKGTSAKRDCGYQFYAKEYSKRPGTVIVKFHCEAEDSVQSCSTMQHCTTAGLAAHAGELVHDLQYTQEIRQIVVSKLKAHVMPKVIRQGGRHINCDIMKRQFNSEGHARYISSHFKEYLHICHCSASAEINLGPCHIM